MRLDAMPARVWSPADRFADLDAYLNGTGPVGVAVSGGGDSIALLHLLAAWGQRPLEVFCVDHGLNPAAGQWSRTVAAASQQVGAGFTSLTWTGLKPVTGLAAAARSARHRLLAQAARAKGCRVLCLGHTADDVLEARAMRASGSNVGAPQLWSPSPVWPEGRGLFLFRPLLGVRRATLRDWLAAEGLDWIDDPANDNPASLRARVRSRIAGGEPVSEFGGADGYPNLPDGLLYDPDGLGALGLIRLDAARLATLPETEAIRLLAAAAVCAGGGDKLPRREQVARVWSRLAQVGIMQGANAPAAQTLCGARLWWANGRIHVAREAGEMRRRPPVILTEAGTMVWDGRFELYGQGAGTCIAASANARHRLARRARAELMQLPALLRNILPVVVATNPGEGEGGRLAASSSTGAYWCRCLVLPRFLAAAGAIGTERDGGFV